MTSRPQISRLEDTAYVSGDVTVWGSINGTSTPLNAAGYPRRALSVQSTVCPMGPITAVQCAVPWNGDAARLQANAHLAPWFEAAPLQSQGSAYGHPATLQMTTDLGVADQGLVMLNNLDRYKRTTVLPATTALPEKFHLATGARSSFMSGNGCTLQDLGVGSSSNAMLGDKIAISADGTALAGLVEQVPGTHGDDMASIYASKSPPDKHEVVPSQHIDIADVDPDSTHWTGGMNYTGFGIDTAFSGDGRIMAIGMPYYSYGDRMKPYLGAIALMKFDEASWTWKAFKKNPIVQISAEALAQWPLTMFVGFTVALSTDGRTLVATNPPGTEFTPGEPSDGAVWMFSVDPDAETASYVDYIDHADSDIQSSVPLQAISMNSSGSVVACPSIRFNVVLSYISSGEPLTRHAGDSIGNDSVDVMLNKASLAQRVNGLVPRLSADGHYMAVAIQYDQPSGGHGNANYGCVSICSDLADRSGWRVVSGPWTFGSLLPYVTIDDAGEVVHVFYDKEVHSFHRRGSPNSWFYDSGTSYVDLSGFVATSVSSAVASSKNAIVVAGYKFENVPNATSRGQLLVSYLNVR